MLDTINRLKEKLERKDIGLRNLNYKRDVKRRNMKNRTVKKLINYFRNDKKDRVLAIIDGHISAWIKVAPQMGRIESHKMYVYEELLEIRNRISKIL